MPALSPLAMGALARRQSSGTTTPPDYNPGAGSKNPMAFNNDGFLLLFAIIGAFMVLATLWFFFMAKNGGFRWKKGDWEEYKSTVLRRKGPDGKTLSNATKSTKLGMSEVPKFRSEPAYTDTTSEAYDLGRIDSRDFAYTGDGRKGGRRNKDADLQEYKQEKAAKVGGLNSELTGSHYDYSSASAASEAKESKRARKEKERREKKQRKEDAKAAKRAAKNAQNYRPDHADAASYTTYTQPSQPSQQQSYYYNTYRPSQTLRAVPEDRAFSNGSPRSASRQHSPNKRSSRPSETESDTGTKVYPCHIPGLSDKGLGPEDSVSQIGAQNHPPPPQQQQQQKKGGGGGYRRVV